MDGGFRLDNRQRSLFSILSGMTEMAKPPLKKWRRGEKCKFNDDWRSHFAWIAKLLDNGMAQCNLCVTNFSIPSGGRTDIRRHQESARHAKLALRRRVGWSSYHCVDVCHLGESNAGIRHYSDIQCCQRAGL